MVFNIHKVLYSFIGRRIDESQKLQKLDLILESSDSKYTPGMLISIFLLFLTFLTPLSIYLYLLFKTLIVFIIPWISLCVFTYPYMRLNSRKAKIDEELPYAFNYLSTLVSVGLNPLDAFKALINEKSFDKELRREFELILIDCTFFGRDLLNSLIRASRRTPSKKFGNILQSIVSSTLAGSELKRVLMDTSSELMDERKRIFHRKINTLSIFSEIYVVFCIFVPVLIIVSFPIVEALSNYLMFKSVFISKVVIEIFVYLFIPAISVISLLLLDILQPTEVKS